MNYLTYEGPTERPMVSSLVLTFIFPHCSHPKKTISKRKVPDSESEDSLEEGTDDCQVAFPWNEFLAFNNCLRIRNIKGDLYNIIEKNG